MKKIGLINENQHNKIVVLIPKHVALLKYHALFFIESGSGLAAGFRDEEYEDAGAVILQSCNEVLEVSDIILCFDQLPEMAQTHDKKIVIAFLNVLYDFSPLASLTEKNIDLYSLDLMPRTTLAQSMDILSSVASISGYQAVLTAAELLPSCLPMITSAGGTLRPAKFLILGSGVAGLQAIATAKRMGAVVKAFDVRRASKTEVESLGAEFIEIDGALENKNSGGYAVEQTQDYLDKIESVIHEEAIQADAIITTAKIPGKRAPLLLKAYSVKQMKPGSVIVDLAAETGGNCELTKKDQIHVKHDVTIVGISSIISRCSKSASILISGNYFAFISHFLANPNLGGKDEILNQTKVIEDGLLINQKLVQLINQY
jgi:NAD(P) transhydrogenase subunit alpha